MRDETLPDGLEALIQQATAQRLPPVEQWNPPYRGDSTIVIRADGQWYHDGGLIRRPELVRLFASILRREADGRYMLVTPVEKQSVTVEDAPFLAIGVESEGEGQARRIGFRLNTDAAVIAGPDHPLSVINGPTGPKPYLLVRAGLEALISRPVYYQLVEWALADDHQQPGLWSNGVFFQLDATE